MTFSAPMLPCIEIEPDTQAERSLIWLHGLGANGHDFLPIVEALRLPKSLKIRFIFPHAPELPVTINNGYIMPAWFDVVSLTSAERADEAGIRKSMVEIEKLITREISRGVSPNHIVLAGFSQGATMALCVGLEREIPLAGIMALSGYLPPNIQNSSQPALTTLPIFLAHGTQDNVVPYTLGKAACDALKQAGHKVTWHSYPMGHAVCEQEISDIKDWIEEVI